MIFLRKEYLKDRKKISPKGNNKETRDLFNKTDRFFCYLDNSSNKDGFPYEVLKVTSLLYHNDKNDPTWKKWCAYSAFVCWEYEIHSIALAIIAEEWDFIKSKNWKNTNPVHIDNITLVKLACHPNLNINFSDCDLDSYWECFLVGILGKEEEYVVDALRNLKQLEEEESCQYNKLWPAFDIELCAAAAIAKKHGITFNTLEEYLQDYLFAGLNDLKSPSVYEDFQKGY